jgi:hypothetical protein
MQGIKSRIIPTAMTSPADNLKQRWRRQAILNTATAVVVIPLAFVFFSPPVAVTMAMLTLIGDGVIWFLYRRVQRTGKLTMTLPGQAQTDVQAVDPATRRRKAKRAALGVLGAYLAAVVVGAAIGSAVDSANHGTGAFVGAAVGMVLMYAVLLMIIQIWKRRIIARAAQGG